MEYFVIIAGAGGNCVAGGGAPGHDGHLHVQSGRSSQVIFDVYL